MFDDQCLSLSEDDCLLQDGVYAGDGTNCDDNNGNMIPDVCEPDVCEPNADGSGCLGTGCTGTDACRASCLNFDPLTGASTVIACDCGGVDECHAEPAPVVAACVAPDNGSGTVDLPPDCEYLSPQEVHQIIDGLPPETTIALDLIHRDFVNIMRQAGGSLGGEIEGFDSLIDLAVSGTGNLAGFSRHLFVPAGCMVHTGPRNPGDPIQTFPNDMFRLQGELFGDPDFCTFRVTAGTEFGLPSPGQTTLTRLGPPGSLFAVDSFFDITYRIEFQGCPGSQVDGMAGDTTGTIRMVTGSTPDCVGACPPNTECVEQRTVNPDGTIELCCECVDACFVATPLDVDFGPAPSDIGFGAKNRYMTFRGGDAGRSQAVQVEFVNLPDFPYANGRTAWVQEPYLVTEASGSAGGVPPPTMWAARLGCTPFYTDWSAYDRVDVFDDGIVQRSRYDVRIIDASCDCTNPSHYSSPLTVDNSAIGDVVGNGGCAALPCDAPQGVVDFVDISAVVDKFKNEPLSPRKARADLINSNVSIPFPDQKIDFVDISYCVDAFRSTASPPPGPPTTDPCPGDCP